MHDVVIVGAGMAGLTCAVRLKEKGITALILDGADDVGGRIRTDRYEGFLLDRGFQVLLTGYPATSRLLDVDALRLSSFHSGALVRTKGAFTRVGDPLRHPNDLLPTVFSSVGTLWDKASVLRLRQHVCTPSLRTVLARPETTTEQRLGELGFSSEMITRFFRPFLGGIFLETGLGTSSRKFEFVFRMFSEGTAALPIGGMQDIPRQLAAHLDPDQIRLREPVAKLSTAGVELASGEAVLAKQVVVATDAWTAAQLLHQEIQMPAATVKCLYFAAVASPVEGQWLVLNGEGFGPINNLTVPSDVHASYAPVGHSLISVTVLNERYLHREDLIDCVRAQLFEWYGSQVKEWQHLRTYHIPQAVAIQTPPALTPVEKPCRVSPHVVQCGDYDDIVSIEGAVKSGSRAAAEILQHLQ